MKNSEIQIKIDNFEGPLDLLIHLIDKNEMRISEINISQIIDDYLYYIKISQEANLKIKVDFLIMATELIEIKAYSILNKAKKEEREEDLEKRIIEYKLFKEISDKFSESEHEYNVPYRRSGNFKIEEANIEHDISNLNLSALFQSFKALISDEETKEVMFLQLEEDYTMEDANDEIEEFLEHEETISFSLLLKNRFTKARIVTLFLATLDLFKLGKIDIIIEEKEFYLVRLY